MAVVELEGLTFEFPGATRVSEAQRECLGAVAGALAAGEHVLVEMAADASPCLVAVAHAWQRAHPGARVVYGARGSRAVDGVVAECERRGVAAARVGGRREACRDDDGGAAAAAADDALSVAGVRRAFAARRARHGRTGGLPFDERPPAKRLRERCAYAHARAAARTADFVVCDGRALVDPRSAPCAVDADTLVIFDGFEDLDAVCADAFTRTPTLDAIVVRPHFNICLGYDRLPGF